MNIIHILQCGACGQDTAPWYIANVTAWGDPMCAQCALEVNEID